MPYKDPEKQREAARRSMAKRRAADRAKRVSAAIAPADPAASPGLPDPPDRDQLLRILGQRAREGNVPAARQLLEEYRRGDSDQDNRPSDPLGEFDELADRRGRRAG